MLPVLVVNAGSTSLKLELVSANDKSEILSSLNEAKGRAAAIGHRVVHGGERFREPVVLDADVIAEIEAMSEVAPLHNRPALAAIAQARKLFGAEPQVAVFDSAFTPRFRPRRPPTRFLAPGANSLESAASAFTGFRSHGPPSGRPHSSVGRPGASSSAIWAVVARSPRCATVARSIRAWVSARWKEFL